MAMINLSEIKKRPDRLHDLLQWAMLVAPGIVFCKNGSFLRSYRFHGPDLFSATDGELVSISARLNNILRRLGGGWAIFAEDQHRPSNDYPDGHFDCPAAALVDDERRADFSGDDYYESHYYLTLTYMPPPDLVKHASSWFFENDDNKGRNARNLLEAFDKETKRIAGRIASVLPEFDALDDDALCTYLHATVSNRIHPVQSPGIPIALDAYLADRPVISGIEPRIGNHWIGALTLTGFPRASTPGMLDTLNKLGISYRWVTRFIFLDKDESEKILVTLKRQWFSKRKSLFTLLKETMFGAPSVMEDSDAVIKARDADAAQISLSDGAVGFGYFTQTLIVQDTDRARLHTHLLTLERTINGLGFITIDEIENNNCLEAWLGALPGHCAYNVRTPMVSTLNLSHLFPLSSVWAGARASGHLSRYYRERGIPGPAPALFQAVTNDITPYRHEPHVEDVGMEFIIGPIGSGKSVKLNFDSLSWLRYHDWQVFGFDVGGSSRILTLAVGGEFHDLDSDNSNGLAFQPLAGIRDRQERIWAAEWLLGLLAAEGLTLGPEHRADVWQALGEMQSAPERQLTMTTFRINAKRSDVKRAIERYTVSGQFGALFDADRDTLRYNRWQIFEMEQLMQTPPVVVPTLLLLFHRLQQRMNGQPTLLRLDEAWTFLDHPMFQAKLREWLKTLRKVNVKVQFATQSLADVTSSGILATVKESCPGRTYLPNPSALDEASQAIYREFGLNERQIEIIAHGQPKRDYYYTSPKGNRLYELGLGPIARAYCARTSKNDQRRALELWREVGGDPAAFNRRWLAAEGLDWAISHYEAHESALAPCTPQTGEQP
jgi:type IV secretion system protein TrbE